MHYNNKEKRDELQQAMPQYMYSQKSKVLGFINLCIHPHRFETVYSSVRSAVTITNKTYACVQGTVQGLLVLVNRQHRYSLTCIDAYTPDFIDFIRNDTVGDPVKFLLSMRAYMYRYMFLKGLRVAFGINWRVLVFNALELPELPKSHTSYHSLLTNKYVRNLLRAYVVYKNYRTPDDPEYELGVNDVVTLLDKAALAKTSYPRHKVVALFEVLCESLPCLTYSIRRKAAFAIDTCNDAWEQIHYQFNDIRYKNTQG
jgi:hypothetical protein